MRLPRLTWITTVRIVTKSGAIIEQDFRKFSYRGNGEGVTNLKWVTDNDSLFYIVIDEIAVIRKVRARLRIRLRHRL